MAPTVSVVVQLHPNAGGLVDLVHSLDAQSAPPSDFEVLFVGVAAGSSLGKRLSDLVRRRPNVRVVEGPLADGVEAAAGEWLLVVPPSLCAAGVRLQPEALARLAEFATAHGNDAVLARVSAPGGSRACDLLVCDTAHVEAVPPDAVDPGLVLYRAAYARRQGVGADPGAVATALSGANVGAAGAYPAASVRREQTRGTGRVAIDDVVAEWQDGAALVTVSGQAGSGAGDRAVLLSVRRHHDGLEFWLDGDGKVDESGAFNGTARLDPRTAALGAALTPGLWEVRIGVHGSNGAWSPRTAVPATPLKPAILDDLLVAVDGGAASLVLDIGATRGSVVGRLTASQVEISESARGTLLTANLPDVEVTGSAHISGYLLLGKFPLAASLETDGGVARLSCFLSGLAGTSSISTRFGSRPAATGLDLTIDGVGVMAVRPTPPKPPATPAPDARRRPAPPASVVARLRHAVPAPLEPAVRKLSGNPTARQLYRRLTGAQ